MSWYAFLNILPGITIARYWSEAIAFKPKQLKTVLAKRPNTVVAIFKSSLVILAKAPIASIIPPNTIAQQINKMVHIIPFIPPDENSSLSFSLSVAIWVSVKIELKIAANLESDKLVKISGWKIKANIAARTTPVNNAIRGLVFIKIKAITTTGTINRSGVILNVLFILVKRLLISALPVVSIVALKIENIIIVTNTVGTVVKAIYLMCVNKSVPAIAGARFVVSLKGDILSPK